MKFDAVKWSGALLLMFGLMAGSAWAAWKWQANAYGKQLADLSAAHQIDMAAIASAAATQMGQALGKQQAAEQARADIDAIAIKEKASDLAENKRLRADVAAGNRRLRIAGRCSSDLGNLSETTSASGLDDGATVELSGAAGRVAFDIRAGIIKDQTALKGLQEYVREVCR